MFSTKEKWAKDTIVEFAQEEKQTLFSFIQYFLSAHFAQSYVWPSNSLGDRELPALMKLRMGQQLGTGDSRGDKKSRDLV